LSASKSWNKVAINISVQDLCGHSFQLLCVNTKDTTA
jgi:hypothetical protein